MDDDHDICDRCSGSGEGMADGTVCHACGGSGGLCEEQDDDGDYESCFDEEATIRERERWL